jgi:hypothetical protein
LPGQALLPGLFRAGRHSRSAAAVRSTCCSHGREPAELPPPRH